MKTSRKHGIGERSCLSMAAMLLIVLTQAGVASAKTAQAKKGAPARFDVTE